MRSVFGFFKKWQNRAKTSFLLVLGLSAVLPTATLTPRGTEGNVNSIFSVRIKEHIPLEESADCLEGLKIGWMGMNG